MAAKSPDLSSMNVPELRELIAAAEARVAEIQAEAKLSMRTQLEEIAAKAGFTLEEILAPAGSASKRERGSKAPGKELPVKFRGPNGEAWTGRGRVPNWLTKLEAEGKNRETFRV